MNQFMAFQFFKLLEVPLLKLRLTNLSRSIFLVIFLVGFQAFAAPSDISRSGLTSLHKDVALEMFSFMDYSSQLKLERANRQMSDVADVYWTTRATKYKVSRQRDLHKALLRLLKNSNGTNSTLQELEIFDSVVSDEDLKQVGRWFPSLKRLVIRFVMRDPRITDAAIPFLPRSLTSLIISNSRLYGETFGQLPPNLEELEIDRSPRISRDSLEALPHTLKILRIKESDITTHLDSFVPENYPSLIELDLFKNHRITGLSRVLEGLPQLERLNLDLNELKDRFPEISEALFGLHELTHLNLRWNSLNLDAIPNKTALAWPKMTSLNLAENWIGSEASIQSLSVLLKSLPGLKVLDLSGNDLGGFAGLRALSPIFAEMRQLTSLRLWNIQPGRTETLVELTRLIPLLQNLETLDLTESLCDDTPFMPGEELQLLKQVISNHPSLNKSDF